MCKTLIISDSSQSDFYCNESIHREYLKLFEILTLSYCRVLAAQPDRSVAISSVGLLTNLAALLRSGPDDNSPLDGRALVAQKVGEFQVSVKWKTGKSD